MHQTTILHKTGNNNWFSVHLSMGQTATGNTICKLRVDNFATWSSILNKRRTVPDNRAKFQSNQIQSCNNPRVKTKWPLSFRRVNSSNRWLTIITSGLKLQHNKFAICNSKRTLPPIHTPKSETNFNQTQLKIQKRLYPPKWCKDTTEAKDKVKTMWWERCPKWHKPTNHSHKRRVWKETKINCKCQQDSTLFLQGNNKRNKTNKIIFSLYWGLNSYQLQTLIHRIQRHRLKRVDLPQLAPQLRRFITSNQWSSLAGLRK